ncbi:MAG: alpha/beta hydrolase [Finegoldia sp.]|nr:alpha/beta hydrolase [Finegoldia sp.]
MSKKNNKLKYVVPVLGLAGTALYSLGSRLNEFVLSKDSSSKTRVINEDDKISLTREASERIRDNRQRELEIGRSFEKDCEEATINSEDGLILRAKYKLVDQSHIWALLVHGYKADNMQMMPYAKPYYDRGYNVLMPDNRAHGESDGNYVGMGYLDMKDLICWIDWILERDPAAKIIMHGISMGAAAVMMVAGERPAGVVGYVEDCGYTDAYSIIESEFKKRNKRRMPYDALMKLSNFVAKINSGYSYDQASAIDQVKKADKPIMFIHGAKDDFVPVTMGYELYYTAGVPKDFYLVIQAGHAQVKDYDPIAYWNKVFSFIDTKVLKEG